MQKLTAVTTQGSASRAGEEVDEVFTEIFEKEVLSKRQLPALEVLSKEDLILTDRPEFSISLLKNFLRTHEVKTTDDEEEEIIGDETDILKVSKVSDEGKDKINIVYSYSYEVEENIFEENLVIELSLGLNADKKTIIHFERLEGNQLYFKKVVNDLKRNCLA